MVVEIKNFLEPGIEQLRHQNLQILESYSNDWDLLAELAQNSVDAISQENPIGLGEIAIKINSQEKTIRFSDNGCGISPNDLPSLLRPFSTGKKGNPNLIGEKGVGISFVIFSSSKFYIESHHKEGSCRARIENANAWLSSDSEEPPVLQFERIEGLHSFGTTVEIQLPEHSNYTFFEYTFNQLKFILLSRTAIGDVRTVWGKNANKTACLEYLNLDGVRKRESFECSYCLPISNLKKTEYISLADFEEWIQKVDRSDSAKRTKLKNKLMIHSGATKGAGVTINYWACFVPNRKFWDHISVKSKLVDHDLLDLTPHERNEKYIDVQYLFSGGLFISTRNMPTGIRSDLKPKGVAGYLPNFFIIFEHPSLRFDIGRKTIPHQSLSMLQKIGDTVFTQVLKYCGKYGGGEPDDDFSGWDKSAIFNEIKELPDLDSTKTKFIKRPSNQEATVAAIFFEMIGSNQISDITPYISGYKNKYDLYAKFMNSDVVVEFKYSLESLLGDFDDATKLFKEVDIVVVWEVTEKDHAAFGKKGFNISRIEDGVIESSSNFHYEVSYGIADKIKVVCLRYLLD